MFSKALKKDQSNKDSYYGLGISAYEQKAYSNSIKFFNKAIEFGKISARKDRGFAHYHVAENLLHKGSHKESLIAINKSLLDFPTLESALLLKPRILIENILEDMNDNKPESVENKYQQLMNQDKKYLYPIEDDFLKLNPQVLLFLAKYDLSRGYDKIALSRVKKIINSTSKYANKYNRDAIKLRGYIYEYKSQKEFDSNNYDIALEYIQKALRDIPKKQSFVLLRAKIYEKKAQHLLSKNSLIDALKFVSLAIEEGEYDTQKSSIKLRSEIYFAFAVNQRKINDKIRYAELSYKDAPYDSEIKDYIYNLYLSLVALLVDDNNLLRARDIFEKAIKVSDVHKSTYGMFNRNLRNEESIFLDAAIAEIYAINLRYKDAINHLNKHKYDTSFYYKQLLYDLARYYALNNERHLSLQTLRNFYTKKNLYSSYGSFRNRAKNDPSFILLTEDESFYDWLNGINRIKLSLNSLVNIPQTDWASESDSFLQITQNSNSLLTTPKAQDKSNVYWPKNLFRVVFDYDVDDPLIFKLSDSDLTYDDLIFYGKYNDFYPGGWNVILNEKTNTVLNIEIEDCSSCPTQYTTFNSLPPKNSFFASWEDRRIRENLDHISTIYVPKIAEDYGRVNQSYYFISGIIDALAPCFATYAVAISERGFVTKQIFYWHIQYLWGELQSYKRFTIEAFIEYMVSKVGNRFLQNANNFRVFCDCAYGRIKG
ncbi:tetratricopeptide repeat protein [Muricauda sp. JGD-17]|uniref:Tetratricopeptide repeat protein n=1 Tax=Flagellimonas ochracea TaxID=2696472 RepID=A0A964TF44_9FLAO|nr:tetratricopeptide repeat protein [Allomuricauda ochracea]